MNFSGWLDYRHKLQGLIDKHKGSDLPAEVVEQHMAFCNHLIKFRCLQQIFQPEAAMLLTAPLNSPSIVISDDDNDVQSTSLLLPSSLPPEILIKTSVKLAEMEKELQLGQCQDALAQLCSHLHSQAQILKDKYINITIRLPTHALKISLIMFRPRSTHLLRNIEQHTLHFLHWT